MFDSIILDGPTQFGARIKVVGVGGGGGNAINNMIEAGIDNVQYVVANTDAQALYKNRAETKIAIGQMQTRGLGAGAKPEVGHLAAMENREEILAALADADMVFITAGMGGGTGTGAAPVVAQAARENGALTVAIVTRPFTFEGKQRGRQADDGLRELADAVDTLIVIPNDRILQMGPKNLPLKDSFRLVDSVLVEAVRGISEIILTPGLVNVDFADVTAIMRGKGLALMGTGRASGDDRAAAAARMAISSPLLEDARIEGATGLLVSITGGLDMGINDINEAMSLIQDSASADTNTIFGATVDESMGNDIKVTVIATGFDRMATSRFESNYRSAQVPASATSSRIIPPPPNGRAALRSTEPVQDTVRVYAAAATAEQIGQLAQAAPLQGNHNASQRRLMQDIDTPAFVRNTPGYGTPAMAQEPRRQVSRANPFDAEPDAQDRPAYMRK